MRRLWCDVSGRQTRHLQELGATLPGFPFDLVVRSRGAEGFGPLLFCYRNTTWALFTRYRQFVSFPADLLENFAQFSADGRGIACNGSDYGRIRDRISSWSCVGRFSTIWAGVVNDKCYLVGGGPTRSPIAPVASLRSLLTPQLAVTRRRSIRWRR